MTERSEESGRGSAVEVLLAFLRLGCTSFGGPIAHLGYFRAEFVERRRWLTEESFAELVAIAQSLPGPASSQVGYAVGLLRAGWIGGVAAWLGFTLPSASLMLAFAFGHNLFAGRAGGAILHGLQLVAVAVVAQAVLAMQRTLAPDRIRMTMAVIAVAIVLLTPSSLGTLIAIACGAVAGLALLRSGEEAGGEFHAVRVPRTIALVATAVFLILLAGLLLPASAQPTSLSVFAAFCRAGTLVFGGGHVVLPLLEDAVVAKGWMSQQAFLSGYGAAQAVPGPLFTFAAYLGAAIQPNPHPLLLGMIALAGIFLPGLALMTAVLPFWGSIRSQPAVRAALRGVNASVVGVLIAALYRPIWSSTVQTAGDFCAAIAIFLLLVAWRLPPWMVVLCVCLFCGLRALAL